MYASAPGRPAPTYLVSGHGMLLLSKVGDIVLKIGDSQSFDMGHPAHEEDAACRNKPPGCQCGLEAVAGADWTSSGGCPCRLPHPSRNAQQPHAAGAGTGGSQGKLPFHKKATSVLLPCHVQVGDSTLWNI